MTNTLSILSWNVNGIRAAAKKGFVDWLDAAAPDILALQETRAEAHQVPATIRDHPSYYTNWNHSKARKGYSGTGLLSKEEPLAVQHDLGIEEFDQEGRTLIAEYPSFVLLNS
ncbi:MAG: endonuclease/exonuclease/phosphatase family protein, partial [Anaerolineae bacterium]|nr:endonuclease/exonuclease/phosphatase family protein [Anaerolineae bacterium]